MKSFFLLILLTFTFSCTHSIHLVNVSDFNQGVSFEEGVLVKSEAKQFVIFHFTSNTDYVDAAYQKLIEKCPQGDIQGITTRFSTSHGFFSWTNKVVMQGLCVK